MQLIKLLSFSQHCFLSHFTPQYPQLTTPFHSTTIFTLAHLLPLSRAHLPQQKTPFKLTILYNESIADAHPSFPLEEAILWHLICQIWIVISAIYALWHIDAGRNGKLFGYFPMRQSHSYPYAKIPLGTHWKSKTGANIPEEIGTETDR